MWEGDKGRLLFSLFKASVFLAVGSLIGFLLGLAYASHLYGTPPVVALIQSWLTGDSLIQGPLPVDVADKSSKSESLMLMNTPVSVIPQLGACFGFAISASVLCGSVIMRAFFQVANDASSKQEKPVDPDDTEPEVKPEP